MSHETELTSTDIREFLAQNERKELLRLLTCGSVDDGKSTLIGRLLHDSKTIYEDQLAAITQDSVKFGTTGDEVDLALLVDGLQAEREQGITIDVAYRYFSTSQRKYIIADTPGHEQYTRNMATGASTSNLAIILIDARKGVLKQTRRHSFIVSLLGIRHVIVAINKMDLVEYRHQVFDDIRRDYLDFIDSLKRATGAAPEVGFIPLSALKGDNVVHPSANMPWYDGPSLMTLLDTIEIFQDHDFADVRFPVQYVNRPNPEFRGYSGTLAAGVLRPGDAVVALPSRNASRVKAIVTYDGNLQEAFPPQAITVTLEDEIDVSRGDMLASPGNLPLVGTHFYAHVVWMSEDPLIPGKRYYIKQTTRMVTGSVSRIHHRIDVNTLERVQVEQLKLNGIALCEMALSSPFAFDDYARCKGTGSFIVIDRLTNVTVGAGMIAGLGEQAEKAGRVTAEERARRFGQKAVTVWVRGANARELAYRMERRLFDLGHAAAVLDEETLAEKAAEIAQAMNRAGLICLCVLGSAVVAQSPEDLALQAEGLQVEDALRVLREGGVL
ncbi:MAG: sulfate adenylyltransferase subunit CysN [Acidobacteria bacterium RIFCSPLOWO2_02_FULL_60_20]|nr:MAG: sulfate adenylyltransferase subunit CysN [Acidobacteria bacterium RIFCSPLOWO2_02_FULL_60_20]